MNKLAATTTVLGVPCFTEGLSAEGRCFMATLFNVRPESSQSWFAKSCIRRGN